MSDEPIEKPRRNNLGNGQAKQSKNAWDIVERLAKILSLVAVPFFLAFISFWGQREIQTAATAREYAQIAITILQEPDEEKASPALKAWATDIINRSSPVPIEGSLLTDLISGTQTIPIEQNLTFSESHANLCNNSSIIPSPDKEVVTIFFSNLVHCYKRKLNNRISGK